MPNESNCLLFGDQLWSPPSQAPAERPAPIRPRCRDGESQEKKLSDAAGKRSIGPQEGVKYGQLTVVEDLGGDGTKRRVVCRCDCGDVREYGLHRLRREKNPVIQCKKCSPAVKAQNAKHSENKKDYVGHKFGYLEVVGELEPHHYQGVARQYNARQVSCLCTMCGRTCKRGLNRLREMEKLGMVIACRTCLGRMRRIDLSGRRFGRLHVERMADEDYIRPSTGERYPQYECLCDCGQRKTVLGTSLARGTTKSCGCLITERNRRVNARFEDLTGQKFERLTVLSRAPTKGNLTMWWCRCSCGTVKSIAARSLKVGLTRSCGCLARELLSQNSSKDYIGMTFGDLTGVGEAELHVTPRGYEIRQLWCRCSCGDVRKYLVTSLTCGADSTRRCPKCSMSMSGLERLVAEYLDGDNYDWFTKYQTQVKFDGLTGVGMKQLSYDFVLLDKDEDIVCLVECQGKQHYEPVDYFGGEEKFERQQFHDELKREFAEDNDIPLVEIPYTVHTLEEVDTYFAPIKASAKAA